MAQATSNRTGAGRPAGRRGHNRRQQYIDTAATVFYERGYGSATIADIADRIGVTNAAMYYYVSSKEDLLYEIIREMHLLNLANLERFWEPSGTAMSRLWRYFEGHARINLENVEKTAVVYRELDHLSTERRGEIVELRNNTQAFVRGLLEEAVAEGSVCSLINVELTSTCLFSWVNSSYNWYVPGGQVPPTVMAGSITDALLGSVACTGADDATCLRHNPPVPADPA